MEIKMKLEKLTIADILLAVILTVTWVFSSKYVIEIGASSFFGVLISLLFIFTSAILTSYVIGHTIEVNHK